PSPNKCITDCSLKAGKKCWSKYTQDIHSPNFVDSFSCLCDDSNPGHGQFLKDNLECIVSNDCGFFAMMEAEGQEAEICKWYNEHKKVVKPTESHSSTEKPKSSASSVHPKSTEHSTVGNVTHDSASHETTKVTESHKATESRSVASQTTIRTMKSSASKSYKHVVTSMTSKVISSQATTSSNKSTKFN
ncbi:hypothetical protein K493DRAFT_200363, partial [Basidiobolus meristosporus CBS 931.73]